MFGSTEVSLPTLVEEYVAYLATRPDLSRDQLRTWCDTLRAQESERLEPSTCTMFGSCRIGRPPAKRELAAIERARKAGDIDATIGQALERLVGRTEAAIIGGVAQAALA